MKIGYIVFEGITWLDFIGIYDPLYRLKSMKYLPDLSWEICSFTPRAFDPYGLEIKPTQVNQSLSGFDIIVVPGGHGTRQLVNDMAFLSWIKTSNEDATKISICTGSLILGAAGYLKNKKATTNYNEYEALAPYCSEVVQDRIAEDGNVITAGAVSASIDLGLYLCEKWAGKDAAIEIRKKMDYHG